MWCLLILCSLTWFLPERTPRWFCSTRWSNKWYQSRWLIGLVLRNIYEKHRKSSRQGGSSGESRGVVRRCDGQILECGEGAKKEGELNAQCGDSHLRGRLLRFKCFELDVVSSYLVFPHLVPPRKDSPMVLLPTVVQH
ncbi:hypothetical protein PIB30_075525 [Stylosanthes scabra]|uniref:Secreted protein n=1 Tax=Stylosanthes scabra TaxID=79078 RepID=A0ABU6ZNL4_9FABA|nr:hypothetical protein [Stylosanthes scabra]